MADTKTSALTALTGANVEPAADVMAVVDNSTTTTKKILIQELFNALTTLTADAAPDGEADYVLSFDNSASASKKVLVNKMTSFKVGSFTRDTATANGTQAVTGVGFLPKAVIFLAGQTGTSKVSVGFDDLTTGASVFQNIPGGVSFFNTQSGFSISVTDTAGTSYDGEVSVFGADGFTVTWTRSGAPTGTITIFYLALR